MKASRAAAVSANAIANIALEVERQGKLIDAIAASLNVTAAPAKASKAKAPKAEKPAEQDSDGE